MAKTFQHADDMAMQLEGKGEGTVQTKFDRKWRSGEIVIMLHVGHPERLPTGPHTTGQSDATTEGVLLAEDFKGGLRDFSGVPHMKTAQ